MGRSTVIDLYDGAIRTVDADVGSFLSGLKRSGLYEDALIVVTADHGEQFGEHGTFADHGGPPYQELVHVPLIIKFPGNRFGGTRIQRPVRHVDIPHTILDAVGDTRPFGTFGRSLLTLLRKDAPAAPAAGEQYPVFAAGKPFREWMVQSGNLTYHAHDPRQKTTVHARLFNLSEDPHQQHPITRGAPMPRLAAMLEQIYQHDTEQLVIRRNLTAGMREQLRAMGYLE